MPGDDVTFSRPRGFKTLIGRIIEIFTEELDIPMQAGGSTTWRKEDLQRGLEADECYYVQHEPQICHRDVIDLSVDPPPDLAIEVEIGHSILDKLAVYAALRVPESGGTMANRSAYVYCSRTERTRTREA